MRGIKGGKQAKRERALIAKILKSAHVIQSGGREERENSAKQTQTSLVCLTACEEKKVS